MPLAWKNGKLAWKNGKLAWSCSCCGRAHVPGFDCTPNCALGSVPSSYTVAFGGVGPGSGGSDCGAAFCNQLAGQSFDLTQNLNPPFGSAGGCLFSYLFPAGACGGTGIAGASRLQLQIGLNPVELDIILSTIGTSRFFFAPWSNGRDCSASSSFSWTGPFGGGGGCNLTSVTLSTFQPN